MPAMSMLIVRAAALTDVGLVRTTNEDAVELAWIHPDPVGSEAFAVVADGMGGHAGGELASRLAVAAVVQSYLEMTSAPIDALPLAIERANRAIFDAAARDTTLVGMGTTCTALAIRDGLAWCAHVGDSRLYLARGGRLYTMTEDHSSVARLVAQGALTPRQARDHADRHVLLRAVGTAPHVEVSRWGRPFPLRAGDRFLLCTDGLHGPVHDEELLHTVVTLDPDQACAELVSLARARGGTDNITAAVVLVEGARS